MANSAHKLLEATYTMLDFEHGDLLAAETSPAKFEAKDWIDKGDWLSLASQVGAESVFFVKDNPVIVFASWNEEKKETPRELFNRIWCMARPQRLFLATPGKLSVYDLTKPPVLTDEGWKERQPLAVVEDVAQVAEQLKAYHRERLESDKLADEERFGSGQRADKALIQDLKTLRDKLTNPDPKHQRNLRRLPQKYAHALIGRSIFIRYLEDRKILVDEDFEEVASQNPEWQKILNQPSVKLQGHSDGRRYLYAKILSNKDLTYAFFDQLARNFHGDMFPSDPDEKAAVDIEHLLLLQSALQGDIGVQKSLFFWAYKFDIIPIELISSIYEEFYQTSNRDTDSKGTHYTPSALVRFLLAQILTPDRLKKNPRILDPCCGSGIFLVEAFRRIVRYRVHKRKGKKLTSAELRAIVRDQIAGIELNEEAIRIAAFSLYLAILHFQEPPAIRKQVEVGQHLPSLVYQDGSQAEEQFNCLVEANAFEIAETIHDPLVQQRFSSGCADIVVGNPPWGQVTPEDDVSRAMFDWCYRNQYPVGDKERSQAFIWRTMDLLKEGGFAALLVSTGVFFKHQDNSQDFRKCWLSAIRLIEVINFSHVRTLFFNGAISPFASVVFQKISKPNIQEQIVNYFSAKKSSASLIKQAVILSDIDLQRVPQQELIEDDRLWKVYWWGNHRDYALIRVLDLNPSLRTFCDLNVTGRGYEKREGSKSSKEIQEYKVLPSEGLGRYGSLDMEKLKSVPERIGRLGKSKEMYSGMRILVKRGIAQGTLPKGQIVARFETAEFCFKNSIFCIKLIDPQEWRYKVILAIFWSSLARYYFFMTASTWGMWHHEIHLTELLSLPIRFPTMGEQVDQLVQIVEQLQRTSLPVKGAKSKDFYQLELLEQSGEDHAESIARLEYELDEVVFDLYGLRAAERDLIRDMCDVGIEFYYNDAKSNAISPFNISSSSRVGIFQDIQSTPMQRNSLKEYLSTFLKLWNREIYPEGEFRWRIVSSDIKNTMLCIVFTTQNLGQRPSNDSNDLTTWAEVLMLLDDSLLIPYNSNQIYIDGIVRAVTDTNIIIIKRNEMRLWTKSMARADAEATLLQAMNLQSSQQDISA